MYEVFDKSPASTAFDQRQSFYIELDQSKDIIEKFSICQLESDSAVLQERPVDKIYDSDDCKQYLEGFDYTYEPIQETIINEQILAYRQEHQHNKLKDIENTK
jgi:hypothetical protein